MDKETLSDSERRARKTLILLARTIALNYGEEVGMLMECSDDH